MNAILQPSPITESGRMNARQTLELDAARSHVQALLALNDRDDIQTGELAGMYRILKHAEQVMHELAERNRD